MKAVATLDMLDPQMKAKGLGKTALAHITGISDRLLADYMKCRREPTLGDAIILSRVLNTAGVVPLMIASERLSDCDLGYSMPNDHEVVNVMGAAVPLATAARVSVAMGLSDPSYLIYPDRALLRQIWSIVEQGERVPGPGHCPWCAADIAGDPAGHLSTCLPNNLWGVHPTGKIGVRPTPSARGRDGRGGSFYAHGLKRLREAFGARVGRPYTQSEMCGPVMGIGHYSRVERCVVRLPYDKAMKLAQMHGVTVDDIYGVRAVNEPHMDEIG